MTGSCLADFDPDFYANFLHIFHIIVERLVLGCYLYGNMSNSDKKLLLREAFTKLATLPQGELERLLVTIDKRCEKWGDGVLKEAPEFYQNRPASEKPSDFLRRVYADQGHLNGRLTTAHIDIIDPPLGVAVRSWVKYYGSLPEDINLPLKQERKRGPSTQEKRKQSQLKK